MLPDTSEFEIPVFGELEARPPEGLSHGGLRRKRVLAKYELFASIDGYGSLKPEQEKGRLAVALLQEPASRC